ncbi:MAG: hypothetical protein CL947_02070 [Epsilonproteobacteria bacterium]|nr:hypothetical protein [Campylobacterota bacterium]|tara:strand:+ start:303 stop:1142 length:840 start_codon:yes stop_codon:yes gene_type:complete
MIQKLFHVTLSLVCITSLLFALPSQQEEHDEINREFKKRGWDTSRLLPVDKCYQCYTLDDICSRTNPSNAKRLQDLADVFEYLKKKRKLSFNVGLKLCKHNSQNEGPCFYSSYDRSVQIFPTFFTQYSTSEKLFSLLHELEHAKQHERSTAWRCYKKNRSQAELMQDEYEADDFAASTIKCPVCLKVNQVATLLSDLGNKSAKKGYFSRKDYQKYIDAVDNSCLCEAHKNNGAQFFKKAYRKATISKASTADIFKDVINEDDRVSSLMKDRLSTLRFID